MSGIVFLLMLAQTSPATMPTDSWMAAPNSKMRSVAPTNGQFPGSWGVGGPAMVLAAWGGGALDTKRDRLILWGGGHADYYGNELYGFSISTLTWTRITDPFVNPVMDQEVNGDGTPNSRHTYGGLAYIAHADRFFGQAGSLAGVGFAKCDLTWTFDFDAKTWANRNPPTTSGGGLGVNSSYDPATRKVWWGGNGLWSYDYDANTWAKHNGDEFYYYTSAIDSQRGQLVVVGNGKVFSYDLKNGNYVKQTWATTGGDTFIAKGNVGFDYDSTLDRFVGWRGGSPYILDPVSKIWTAGSATGAPSEGSNGVYGRWRYVPSVNAFVVVTSIDDHVYFYKASTGGGTPPSPAPAPAPTPPPPAPAPGGSSDGDAGEGLDEKCACGTADVGSGHGLIVLAAGALLVTGWFSPDPRWLVLK